VFPSTSTQEVFTELRPLIISVVDGFDVSILAYGQSRSGKTHTMLGSPSNWDVNYLTMNAGFQKFPASNRGFLTSKSALLSNSLMNFVTC